MSHVYISLYHRLVKILKEDMAREVYLYRVIKKAWLSGNVVSRIKIKNEDERAEESARQSETGWRTRGSLISRQYRPVVPYTTGAVFKLRRCIQH